MLAGRNGEAGEGLATAHGEDTSGATPRIQEGRAQSHGGPRHEDGDHRGRGRVYGAHRQKRARRMRHRVQLVPGRIRDCRAALGNELKPDSMKDMPFILLVRNFHHA